jgi:hypothetical protein
MNSIPLIVDDLDVCSQEVDGVPVESENEVSTQPPLDVDVTWDTR